MSTLWELSIDLVKLQEAIEVALNENNEHEAEQIFKTYLEVESGFEKKVENVIRYIRHQESVAQARKEEAKRLSELAKSAENEAERLRQYLVNHLVRIDKKKVETNYCKVGLRKKPAELVIVAEVDQLPDELVRVKKEPNKTAIKDAVKNGEVTSEIAYLSKDTDFSLTIK